MKVKFIKDFPSIEGTKGDEKKGRFYPKDSLEDLRQANAQTAIEAGFAVLDKGKKSEDTQGN